jgi:hypothetical protein
MLAPLAGAERPVPSVPIPVTGGASALTPLGHASPWRWRAVLACGCAAAAVAGVLLGDPAARLAADAELAALLRGMGVVKAGLAGIALALSWWRFRVPVAPRFRAIYLVGTWAMTGASALIWQLSFIPAAALLFHVGELALLLAALCDDDLPLPWRAPRNAA